MILEKIITRERVKLGISDVDKWAVIEDLADLIVSTGGGTDREAIINDTFEREYKGSTAILPGIAIPHARTGGVTELIGALGISREGIDFEAQDGRPCHLVFLIIAPPPPGESTSYLKALSAVAFIGKDENLVSRLRTASSPDDVISILEEVEGGNH